jgi:hypothetical protein
MVQVVWNHANDRIVTASIKKFGEVHGAIRESTKSFLAHRKVVAASLSITKIVFICRFEDAKQNWDAASNYEHMFKDHDVGKRALAIIRKKKLDKL